MQLDSVADDDLKFMLLILAAELLCRYFCEQNALTIELLQQHI